VDKHRGPPTQVRRDRRRWCEGRLGLERTVELSACQGQTDWVIGRGKRGERVDEKKEDILVPRKQTVGRTGTDTSSFP